MAGSNRDRRSSKTADAGIDELAKLRAEVEILRRETEQLKSLSATRPAPKGRWRKPVAIILIVLGCLLAAVSVPAVWLNRTVMDTDAWVETVGPLAKDPAIQNAVANAATDQLFERVDVEELAEQALPPKADFLAGPLAAQVQNFARDAAHSLVRSPTFNDLWIEANRSGHATVIAALTGTRGKYVSVADGQVTLDLSPIVRDIKGRLNEAGLGVVTGAVSGIGGKYVLFSSPALAQASQAVKVMNNLALLFPLLALALLLGSVAVAGNRRHAVFWIGVGLTVAMTLTFEGVNLARYPYISAVERLGTIPSDAALAAYNTIFAGLQAAQLTMLAFGLVLSIGAALAGPSQPAVRLRSVVQGGLQELGSTWDFGSFGDWVHEYRPALRAVGFAAALLVLLIWSTPGVAGVVWVAVAALAWVLLVEFFGRQPLYEEAPAEAKPASRAKPAPGRGKKAA